MKKRLVALLSAIVLCGALLLGVGIYLKYQILKPLGLYQQEFAAALPFMLLANPGMREDIRRAREEAAIPPATETLPPTTTAAPTEQTTPPTQPPLETTPPTELPTEPILTPVEESWYDDVLFIGDSRTDGLRTFCRSGKADYFAATGMTVFNWWDMRVSDAGFSKQSLKSLLGSKTYGKIIIALGINECGYAHDALIGAYKDLLSFVQERQPEAKIILHSIMTVGRNKEQDGWYFSPENIFAINDRIAELADAETVFYIDCNERFADENGYLPEDYSADGCHLYAEDYALWGEWLDEALGKLGI